MLRYLMVCFALLAMPQVAGAQSASSGAQIAPQPANAMQLSRLVNPEDKILEAGDRAFTAGFKTAMAQDKESAAALEEHPKLLDAIFDRALPVVRKHVAASVPDLQEKAARFYADHFTRQEIDQLLAFYGSPTGSKFIAGTYAGLDMSKVADAVGPDGKDPVPAETLRGVMTSAAIGTLPSFDEADWKRFIEFTRMPVFTKLRKVTPEMLKLMTEIANKPNPALDAEIEQVVAAAIESYFTELGRADTAS